MTSNPDNVHVVLLAAGVSRRFGGDKRCAVLPTGRTLLEQARTVVESSGLNYSIACRPDDPVTAYSSEALPVTEAADGMGSTIAASMRRLGTLPMAVLVLPADLPLLSAQTLINVAKKSRVDRIVRPRHHGQFGHPVSFGRQFFRALMALEGEAGARSTLEEQSNYVFELAVNDPGILCDIDTPQALSALELSQFPVEHR